MDRKVKIILIVAGITAGVLAVSLTIYFVVKNKNEKDKAALAALNPLETNPVKTTSLGLETNTPGTGNYLIAPTFNAEKELSNPIQQLKGRYLYPKTKEEGGTDYANIRSSAEVNTSSGWWDRDNQIATIYRGTPIGTVISDTTGVFNNYAYRWFKVKLQQPIGEYFSSITEAYVRADTVTFKPV